MNKYTLLAGAAVLSTIALTANAADLTTTISATATIAPTSMTISNPTSLNFGLLMPDAGKTYTVDPRPTAQNPANTSGTARQIADWMASPGHIKIEAPQAVLAALYTAPSYDTEDPSIMTNNGTSIVIDLDENDKITLKDENGAGQNICGVVSNLTQAIDEDGPTNGSLEIYYGGTVKLADDIATTAANGAICAGETTVTLILHDAAFGSGPAMLY